MKQIGIEAFFKNINLTQEKRKRDELIRNSAQNTQVQNSSISEKILNQQSQDKSNQSGVKNIFKQTESTQAPKQVQPTDLDLAEIDPMKPKKRLKKICDDESDEEKDSFNKNSAQKNLLTPKDNSDNKQIQDGLYMDDEEIQQNLDNYQHKKSQTQKKTNQMEIEKSASTQRKSQNTQKSSQKMVSSIQTPQFGKTPDNKQNNSQNVPDSTQLVNCDQENQVERSGLDDLIDKTPWWAAKEQHKDKNGKQIGDPDYDPTTLFIPPSEFQKLTPSLKQFWEIKSDHYDKIIFFKLGKFYEIFYEDALITNQYLNLNWMGSKMHTGFPEKSLQFHTQQLLDLGYKVVIVEQMESAKQKDQRNQQEMQPDVKQQKLVQREIVQIPTIATYVGLEQNDYAPKYLLSVRNFQHQFGIIITEAATNKITVGFIDDDENYTRFKTMLWQIKPLEVVIDPDNVTADIIKIFRTTYFKPQINMIKNKNNQWHKGNAFNCLEKKYGNIDENKWPEPLKYFVSNAEQRELIFQSLAGMFEYLKSILILEDIINSARFYVYDPKKGMNTCMILDSQALQHLEILEVSTGYKENQEAGSVFKYLDKTVSFFGKRMLKSWICAPLMDIEKISDRLDAIEDLQSIPTERDMFRTMLKKLPDLERKCANIYKYSIKTNTAKIGVQYEDISSIRLKEFKDLLKNLKDTEKEVQRTLIPHIQKFKSSRLKRLLSYQQNEEQMNDEKSIDFQQAQQNFIYQQGMDHYGINLLPRVGKLIDELNSFVTWEGANKDKPKPIKGILPSYDNIQEEKKEPLKQFDEILKKTRKIFKDNSIDFVESKFKYELEIPESALKYKTEEYEFTSKRIGFQRFRTKEIKDLVYQLEVVEEKEQEELSNFVCFMFKQFHENYRIWDEFVSILAELDCMCSLSIVSFFAGGVMCRPKLVKPTVSAPFIHLKDARHPCLCEVGVNFIPNDVTIGKNYNEDDKSQQNQEEDDSNQIVMLLTGPNMGGKSTVLRMVCVIAILAQIGCYVPAASCNMSVVDRIFTRIGASDKLMEGKSTFFIEMEETSNAVKYSTSNSLIIMDELGRGTSTFDGVAIAYSILKYLVQHVKCRTLFATHYHILLDEFANQPQIQFRYMACHIDEKQEKVIFLYKLKPGQCSSSFGINVAKVVGIDNLIIENAKQKALEFETNFHQKRIEQTDQKCMQIMDVLQNFNDNPNQLDNNSYTQKNWEILNQLEQIFKEQLKIQSPTK